MGKVQEAIKGIGDLEDSYFMKVMNLGLSDDEKRANRALELFNKLQ